MAGAPRTFARYRKGFKSFETWLGPLTDGRLSHMADTPPATYAADDFESAKVIADKLKDVPRERQERILRWVSESLSLASPFASRVKASPEPKEFPSDEEFMGPQPSASRTPQYELTDIRSFVEEKGPRTDIQYVTVAAYYYRFVAPPEERRATIDADFIQESTRLAGRSPLVAPASTLNNAKKQGYLNTHERGQFAISTVGEILVVKGLAAGGGPAPRTSKRKKKTKSKKTVGRK
jgi:hypothetical protein